MLSHHIEESEATRSVFSVVARASGTSLLTTKSALVAFSHVVEEECRGGLEGAYLFGCFQHAVFYTLSRTTWEQMAAQARSAYVFGDLDAAIGVPVPAEVILDRTDPMGREWVIVVDRPVGAMAFAARERLDQEGARDRDRLFDSAWTTDPAAVRRAARICAAIAAKHRAVGAETLVEELARPASHTAVDTALGERLLDRLLPHLEG